MITQEAFPVEPWVVRETRLDLNLIAAPAAVALATGFGLKTRFGKRSLAS